ncbi:MAG: preprotein translocase subunit TatB [Synergistaceae bacterium]|nr:preprotein translocase subunit TatB [Synergistaceae bacterium]
MNNNTTVDARGLSCPQPVILTLNAIKKMNDGEIIILVDTETSQENVCRAGKSQGWETAEVQPEGDAYRIILRKEI